MPKLPQLAILPSVDASSAGPRTRVNSVLELEHQHQQQGAQTKQTKETRGGHASHFQHGHVRFIAELTKETK